MPKSEDGRRTPFFIWIRTDKTRAPFHQSPQEPRVTLKVGGKFVKILVDTRIAHSVLTATGINVVSVSSMQGQLDLLLLFTLRWWDTLGQGIMTHSFLVMPDCPVPKFKITTKTVGYHTL